MDIIYSRLRMPKMGNMKFNNPQRYIFIITVIILMIAYSTAICIIKAINPTLELQSKTLARALAEKLSNEACQRAIANSKYEDFCTIERDTNGNIKLMNLNVININKIMTEIALDMNENLKKEKNDEIHISVGSISGNKLLAGKGPSIKVRVEMLGDIQTSVKSELKSAGINQTLHKIYMDIKCELCIISPYKDVTESISTEVLLAEAVIVGDIPESYYNFNGLTKDDILNFTN